MKKRTFWQRVEEAMLDSGRKPTQDAGGNLVGVSQPSANKWANGGLPTMKTVVALAERLHVCVEWLLTESGPKRPLDKESSYLLDKFSSLPSQRLRDKAVAYIDALSDRGSDPPPIVPERRIS